MSELWLALGKALFPLVVVGSPIAVVVFLLSGLDRRRETELRIWRARAGRPRAVTSIPGVLSRTVARVAGGRVASSFELAPKLAYLVCGASDPQTVSDHTSVVAKLDDEAPTFCVRPLPIIEGERVENTGVAFKKDEEFMQAFLVERTVDGEAVDDVDPSRDKAIREWLSPSVREALLDLPDGWLSVDGKARVMTFSRYGLVDADRIEELVAAADIVFAEYGAGGGPSLLPDEDAPAKPSKGKQAPSKTTPSDTPS
jgi:hypothetical protein